MTSETSVKKGSALKVGDTIEVWWKPGRDTITALVPYKGPLAHIFPGGAQLATFALCTGGMTIDNSDLYNVIGPSTRDLCDPSYQP